jgi:hypothetical protein
MPRLRIIHDKAELERIRGNWYAWAYEMRQLVASLPTKKRLLLEQFSDKLPPCIMTVFGGPPYDWPPEIAYQMAKDHKIRCVDWLNPWFITETGWQRYKEAFESLPDPQGQSLNAFQKRTAEISPERRGKN